MASGELSFENVEDIRRTTDAWLKYKLIYEHSAQVSLNLTSGLEKVYGCRKRQMDARWSTITALAIARAETPTFGFFCLRQHL